LAEASGLTVIVCEATAVAPWLSVTVSVTVNSVTAETVYVCVGLFPTAVAPSPKVQANAAIGEPSGSLAVLKKVQAAAAQE
jgi:hypothetical protein